MESAAGCVCVVAGSIGLCAWRVCVGGSLPDWGIGGARSTWLTHPTSLHTQLLKQFRSFPYKPLPGLSPPSPSPPATSSSTNRASAPPPPAATTASGGSSTGGGGGASVSVSAARAASSSKPVVQYTEEGKQGACVRVCMRRWGGVTGCVILRLNERPHQPINNTPTRAFNVLYPHRQCPSGTAAPQTGTTGLSRWKRPRCVSVVVWMCI